MNYKKTETVGELTTVTEYVGTSKEIVEILKYEELIKTYGWNQPEPLKPLVGEDGDVGYTDNFQGHKLRDTKVTIDGTDVAEKVKKAMTEQFEKLKKLQDVDKLR